MNGQDFPPAYSAPVMRFATFEVDLRARELRRNGLKVNLQKQPFQILEMLLERAGELVTREEIRSRIWPADTFIDFEHSVNTAVKKLRQALGDRAENPLFVETLPRQGFRFIAVLRSSAPGVVLEPAPTSEAVPVAPMNGPPPTVVPSVPLLARGRGALWGALICALAVISAVTYRTLSGRQEASGKAVSPSAIHSIAVLPLANLSSDPAQEYFSDGLTDELITRLAQIGSLQVISRTSIMSYKHTLKKTPEIGRELHVDALVEGTVERVQDRVRIRVQLVRTSVDQHLWAETYDRDLKDILQLETDVARQIAQQIGQLTSENGTQFARVRSLSPEAHENYLKGRYLWNQRTEAGLRAGIQHFKKAIEVDPSYAQAYAGLADSYIMMANWGFMRSADAYPNAEAAARKALELDDQLAEAHTSLAYATFLYRWDWSGAEKRFRRAIELNPNYATAHHFYSVYLMAEGRHQEAQREIRRAQELDPLSLIINSVVGWIYYEGRQYDQAIQQCRKTVEMDPSYGPALLDLGAIYLKTGEYQKAIAQFERARTAIGDKSTVLSYLARAQALSGNKAGAMRILRGLEKSSGFMFVSPWDLALVHLALGNKEQSLSLLEKAVDEHVGWVVRLGVDPALDSLRAEPRFTKLQQRVLGEPARPVANKHTHDVPDFLIVDGSNFVTSARRQSTATIQALLYHP